MAKKEEHDPIEEGRRIQAAAVAAQEAADKHQPTPTQDEADRAKLGLIDEFEPSGDPVTKSETADKAPAKYNTRAASAD